MRISDWLGCWVDQIEPLQLVRYMPGEFFDMHHDLADLDADGNVIPPPKHAQAKRRIITLFVYLNTLSEEHGGCTYFSRCNLRIQPKKGRLVLWSNVTENGLPDPRTVHAGEKIKSDLKETVKYGLNIWICEE